MCTLGENQGFRCRGLGIDRIEVSLPPGGPKSTPKPVQAACPRTDEVNGPPGSRGLTDATPVLSIPAEEATPYAEITAVL